MFEDLKPKSAEERGDTDPESIVDKIVIFFYIVGALSLIAAARALWAIGGPQFLSYAGPFFWLSLAIAVLSFATAPALNSRKQWAMYTGVAAAMLSLPRFPIGTMIGIALLVGLWRIHKGGVLRR